MSEITGTVTVHIVYAAVSVVLTIWLARTLHRHGTSFLRDVFPDREELADSINHLLVTGFYMLNLGYALVIVRGVEAGSTAEVAATLTNRLGVLLLSLGVIHFVNLIVIWKFRRTAEARHAMPTAPQYVLGGPELP